MAGPVPHEVLGLAIFVDVLSVITTVLGLLLCFMLWNHGERISYILMLSASTTVGGAVGLVRHVDYTLNWRDIQIERFENEQHHSYSQSDMFGKADVGWRLVLSWTSIFTYNVDALLVLFWSIALFIGTWDIKVNASTKKTMSIVFKTSAVILPIVVCVVCSIEAIQQEPVAYLVIYNFIMAICLTTGSLLVVIVLLKYLQSRNLFTRFFPKSTALSTSLGAGTMSSVATSRTRTGTDKWLIVRFSIIMICLLVFETAQIIYQIVNYERNRQNSQTVDTSPDFSAEQAKIDISQDIPGTLPSIIAFLIFGTTAPFRRKYARIIRTICCCAPAQRGRLRKDPVPWMMLQPRPQGEASCTSFPDDNDLEGQSKPDNDIRVRTEISTSSVSSATTAAENSSEGKMRPIMNEDVRRVSFGGATLRSQDEPATPPLAHSNPNSRRPSSPTRRHSRTLSPLVNPDSQPGSPGGQPFGSWEWSSHSRQTSISHSRQGSMSHGPRGSISSGWTQSASPGRRPSASSAHSQRTFRNPSWSNPTTPPRPRALPLLPELETDTSPATKTHRRTPSSPKSPRSSKDDPLYQRPISSPKQKNVPPVPRIPAPTEWQRDSTATIESAHILAEISRGAETAPAPAPRADAERVGGQGPGTAGHPGWLTASSARSSSDNSYAPSNRASAEPLVHSSSSFSSTSAATGRTGAATAAAAAAAAAANSPLASAAFDFGVATTAARTSTGDATQQRSPRNHARNAATLAAGSINEAGPLTYSTPRGSPNTAAVTPPSRQSPGGWI